jgi:hypothetical protein
MMKPEIHKTFEESNIFSLLALLVLVACVLMFSFGPVGDGDLWWQMAYGRYFIEHGTLIPDHSIYSWTEAANDYIYCAWIGELALYGVYKLSGMVGLSFLRVLIMLLPLFLLFWMRRREQASFPVVLMLAVLLCYLVSRNAGGLLKPELFSYGLFSILVALYFLIKRSGDDSLKFIYAIPIVMLVWVNTHAAFAVGCLFFGVAFIGEAINYFAKSPTRLSPYQFKHIAYAAGLSMLALFITPYGYEYPFQLLEEFTSGARQENYSNVSAYLGIFDDTLSHLNMPQYLGLMGLMLLPFIAEKVPQRKIDYGLILLIIAFIALSTGYGRLSYFCPVVLLFSLNHLLLDSERWQRLLKTPTYHGLVTFVSLALMIGMVAHRGYEKSIGDTRGGYLGAGYLNPVSETDFVQSYFPQKKICNGYNGGGYLLWKISPHQKVMIDPRYFPFYSWYDDWFDMTASKKPAEKIAEFKCDLWMLNHVYEYMVSALVKMPDWKLVFVGESGVVFVRPEQYAELGGLQLSDGLPDITSLPRTAHILNLFLQEKEYQRALQLAEALQKKWSATGNAAKAERALAFVRGTIAYEAKSDLLAYGLLSKGNTGETVISNQARQIKAGQFLTEKLWRQGELTASLRVAREVLELQPDDLISLYNAAAISLQVADPVKHVPYDEWKWLKRFLELTAGGSIVPEKYVGYAEQMLNTGEAISKPPLRPANRAQVSEQHKKLLDSFLY